MRAVPKAAILAPACALLSIAILLLLPGKALAQCRVEGVVRSAEGTPLGGATVRIEAPDLRPPLTTTAGPDGRYGFDNVKAGTRARIVVYEAGRPVAEVFALVTLWVETVDIQVRPASSVPMTAEDLNPAGGPSGEVGGVVRSIDGLPVPAARVTISDTNVAAFTDPAGHYTFGKLRSETPLELHVSAAGFRPATKEVVVPSGDRLQADFALEVDPTAENAGTELSVLYTPAETNHLIVRPAQVAGVPSLGRKDIFRALQFLPGVTGSLEASADLYVRGGTPDQNLVTWDGFTLYPLHHIFGTFSAINMEAVEKADFSESALGAADGGRLSGVLRLTGRSSTGSKATGFVDLSMLGAGALVSAALGDRGSFLLAARRSFATPLYNDILDRLAGGGAHSARDRAARFSGGTFQISPASFFSDLNGKLDLKPTGKNRLSVSVYDGRDDFNNSSDLPVEKSTAISVPEAVELPSDAVVQTSDIQNWKARGIGATWTRQWSPTAATTFSVGHTKHWSGGEQASLLTSPSTGEDYSFLAGRGGSNASSEFNQVRDTTVRLDSSIGFGFGHVVSAGGEVTALDVDYGLRREVFQKTSDGSAYRSGLVDLLNQAGSGRLITFFAQDGWRPLAKLVLSPGVRVTHYDLTGSRYVEPRLGLTYQLTSLLQLKGGFGIDHQMANRITREDLTQGDREFWSLADGKTVPVARARQVVAGGIIQTASFLFDVEVYHRRLDDLTLFAPRLFPGVAPEEGKSLFYYGTGRALGLELLLQWKSPRNTFWTSYTSSRIEYTYPALEADTFPASHDQAHEFKIADTVRIAGRWSLSAAGVASTGRPYTPGLAVEPVWFPSGTSVYRVTFGAKNSERLPAYNRLDLSTQWEFQLRGFKSTVGATVFNVYDRKNTWFRTYQTIGTWLTANDVTLMRRALNVFVKLGF